MSAYCLYKVIRSISHWFSYHKCFLMLVYHLEFSEKPCSLFVIVILLFELLTGLLFFFLLFLIIPRLIFVMPINSWGKVDWKMKTLLFSCMMTLLSMKRTLGLELSLTARMAMTCIKECQRSDFFPYGLNLLLIMSPHVVDFHVAGLYWGRCYCWQHFGRYPWK